jgi:restriction system protein
MGENLIDWNQKYINIFYKNISTSNKKEQTSFWNNSNITSITDKFYLSNFNKIDGKISYSKAIEKNSFLLELYKSKFTEDDYWFEKHQLMHNDKKLSALKKLRAHLDKLNFNLLELPTIPSIEDLPYPKISFLDKLFKYDKDLILKYENDLDKLKFTIDKLLIRKKSCESLNELYINQIEDFKFKVDEQIKIVHEDVKGDFKNNINKYEEGLNNIYFTNSILKYSILNSLYKFEFNVGEIKDNNHIILDISLPNDRDISNVKAYKEFKRDLRVEPIYYSDRDYKKIYNSIIYSIVFRLIREVFTSDYSSQIKQLTINGWANALNKKNGKYENKCILSLSISGEQYEDIEFSNIDLIEAFRHLKGISAASLIDFVPIAPIISLNKDDKRFIQSEEVLKNLNSSTNIAAIDWEEFEHLVRELFEKEFAVNGGEVKVTQSSRDGGVDAIAFDPDPIRGGKIIIQSKRYTNVVGVSAIRDLYGTVKVPNC